MLSSDKNIENIVSLVETLKGYVELQTEFLKLNVIEKFVVLVTAITIALVVMLIGSAMLLFLSLAAVCWISPSTGMATAFLIVSAFYLALLLTVYHFRKNLIERPLVRFLTNALLN